MRRATKKHKYKDKHRHKNKTVRNMVAGGDSTILIRARKSFMDPATILYETLVKSNDSWATMLGGIDENIRGMGITSNMMRNHHPYTNVKTITITRDGLHSDGTAQTVIENTKYTSYMKPDVLNSSQKRISPFVIKNTKKNYNTKKTTKQNTLKNRGVTVPDANQL
jgi:hypothetical protein